MSFSVVLTATKASEYGQQVIVRVQNCENVAASEIGPYRDENVGENNYISPLKEPVQESHLGSTASKNWFSAKRYYKLFNENATEYCENDRALPFVQVKVTPTRFFFHSKPYNIRKLLPSTAEV